MCSRFRFGLRDLRLPGHPPDHQSTQIGNIFTEDLLSILGRNQDILDGLHTTGKLHFEGCKKCLGSPTRVGAAIKNAVNRVRYD